MSRFYKIVIGAETAAPPGNPAAGPSNNAGATFTNQVGGKADLGALQVELDIPAYGFATPAGYAWVRISGVSLAQISQASDFNGAQVAVSGGMQAGLPLATADAAQSGRLIEGVINSAYGNWLGVNQSLELIIQTDGGATQAAPGDLSFHWKKGQKLSDVITQTLAKAYPNLKTNVNISQNLVLSADEPGFYQTLNQFANYVKEVSKDIVGGNYYGVDITLQGDTLNVFDGTSPQNPRQILFQDLIGQVTWLSPFTTSFSCVMRSDLAVGDVVKFPPLAAFQTTTTQGSQAQARNAATFNGPWVLSYVRHVGNSRGTTAQDWVTTYQAYSASAPGGAGDPTTGTGA